MGQIKRVYLSFERVASGLDDLISQSLTKTSVSTQCSGEKL